MPTPDEFVHFTPDNMWITFLIIYQYVSYICIVERETTKFFDIKGGGYLE
jgi:hypothetical protein